MPPREEDEQEFAQHVRGGDVEVVFKGADGDVAIDLHKSWFSTLHWPQIAATCSACLHFAPYTPARPSPRSCPIEAPFAPCGRS